MLKFIIKLNYQNFFCTTIKVLFGLLLGYDHLLITFLTILNFSLLNPINKRSAVIDYLLKAAGLYIQV